MSKLLRVAVICIDKNDFINWKNQQGHQPEVIDTWRKYQVGNKVYHAISEPHDLCSLTIDKIEETHDAYLNSKYHDIFQHARANLNSPSNKVFKPSAEEFLKSKGWTENSPIIGGALFKGIAELLEEYDQLKPYDPNEPRFPSSDEIHQMAEHYKSLEGPNGPDGSIYVYAGIEQVKEWLKKHGLL